MFGGGQILVPPTWRVITHATGIGGMQDSRPAIGQVEGAPTLTIDGVVVFGGFQVLSELDEGQEEWLRSQEAAADAVAASKAKARRRSRPAFAGDRRRTGDDTGSLTAAQDAAPGEPRATSAWASSMSRSRCSSPRKLSA